MATNTRYLTVLGFALLPFALILAGCPEKETEAPPPATTVAPAPTPTPTVSVATAEEEPDAGPDADADVEDADAGKKPTYKPSNLAQCCAAIRQNKKSAPPTQWPLYDAAIALCQSGAIPPQFRNLAPCK